MYDVLIIGCGITGAAIAFELSRYALQVGILERENDVATGTTKANSAILHAGYDPLPGSLMARLNVRGVALAETLCAALDVPYRKCGSLVVAFTPAEQAVLERLYQQGQANGVPALELLDRDAVHTREPNLSEEVIGALYAPSAAICSPWEFCLALAETAVRNGATLHRDTEVINIERRTGGSQGSEAVSGWVVHTTTGTYTARYVVNAAGVAAAHVHELAAARSFAIRPSRGQYYLLDKSEGTRVSHVIFQCPNEKGKGVLVAPTVHGNLIVGPNAEPVEGNDTATTREGLTFVRECAQKSVPSIAFRDSIRNFAGVRAHAVQKGLAPGDLASGDFLIQEAPDAPGFFDVAGICSPGLTAAPAIAEYVVELLAKSGLPLERKPAFICERHRLRFHELSPEDKARLVATHPAYGRVICRCETVTEGEILDALHAPIPPRSVDAVKRRVKAGMGRCQGGFCGPRVVEILAREQGVSPHQIMQDTAGMWLFAHATKEQESAEPTADITSAIAAVAATDILAEPATEPAATAKTAPTEPVAEPAAEQEG